MTEGLSDLVTREPVRAGKAEVPDYCSGHTLVDLGDAALTLTDKLPDATYTQLTDKRGNFLTSPRMDLREVPDWVHTPSIRRLVSLDVPMAIVKAYRSIPPGVRGQIGRAVLRGETSSPSSDVAQAALSVGGGWPAFWHYAIPRMGLEDKPPLDWNRYYI